jgi:uncharacterized iron-regulated membrane protein
MCSVWMQHKYIGLLIFGFFFYVIFSGAREVLRGGVAADRLMEFISVP